MELYCYLMWLQFIFATHPKSWHSLLIDPLLTLIVTFKMFVSLILYSPRNRYFSSAFLFFCHSANRVTKNVVDKFSRNFWKGTWGQIQELLQRILLLLQHHRALSIFARCRHEFFAEVSTLWVLSGQTTVLAYLTDCSFTSHFIFIYSCMRITTDKLQLKWQSVTVIM